MPLSRRAVAKNFIHTYGADGTKLEGWQQLCRDVGIEAERSITQCRKKLRDVHINICEFVEAMVAGRGDEVQRFASRNALRRYTRSTHKTFPLAMIKENEFLRLCSLICEAMERETM